LTALVDMLCNFQGKLMEKEISEDSSSPLGVCMELWAIASACGQDELQRISSSLLTRMQVVR